MTNITQAAEWFAEGLIGHIPVWNPAGQEVGYMTSYSDNSFTLAPGIVGTPGAKLITKNFFGQDEALTVTTSTATTTNFTRDAAQITLPGGGQLPSWAIPAAAIAGAAFLLMTLAK